jgi:hypothetical protein
MTKSSRASEDLLAQLHEATAVELLNRVKSGDASPADLAAAIRFLKDNKIEAQIEPGDTLHTLYESLPDYDDEEIYN